MENEKILSRKMNTNAIKTADFLLKSKKFKTKWVHEESDEFHSDEYYHHFSYFFHFEIIEPKSYKWKTCEKFQTFCTCENVLSAIFVIHSLNDIQAQKQDELRIFVLNLFSSFRYNGNLCFCCACLCVCARASKMNFA